MKSAQKRSSKLKRGHWSVPPKGLIPTEGDKRTRRSGEAARAAPLAVATEPALLIGLAGSSQLAQPVRRAFDRLKGSIDEATEALETNSSQIAVELKSAQTRAIRSICACALAMIDYVQALGSVAEPLVTAKIETEHFRRRREALNERLADFFESASNLISVVIDPLNDQLREPLYIAPESKMRDDNKEILARVSMLTKQQKRVAELLVEGLPNKVIAYELGITVKTVKSHLGPVFRKLCVRSRARAIAMMAKIDLASTVGSSQRTNDASGKELCLISIATANVSGKETSAIGLHTAKPG